MPTLHSSDGIAHVERLWRGGDREAALLLAEQLEGQEQRFGPLRCMRMDMLIGIGRREQAEAAFRAALDQFSADESAFDGLAFYARRLNLHTLSNEFYRKAAVAHPTDAQLWYNLATSERSLGKLREAREACRCTLAIHAHHMPAVLLRSELQTASTDDNHVADLRSRLAASASAREQMFVAYALGKELHDLGDCEQAFDAFALGARARRQNLSYDVATDEHKISRIMETYDRGSPAGPTPAALDRHIFIIGLPRSGTTLVERILGSLPNVESNGETDNFSSALLESAPSGPGDVFARCRLAPPDAVARRYEILAGRKRTDVRIIEKLPLNYLYVGAIASAFALSPIVWVRRHPVDSCFAMFRTLFGEGYPFSYDFEDLARYYASYDRLMRHWARTLPGRLIEVNYEDLVRTPGTVAESLAQACSLTWEEEALDLKRNATASLTASAAQVRGQIYTSSAGIRQRYERQLLPLARRLQELGVETPP